MKPESSESSESSETSVVVRENQLPVVEPAKQVQLFAGNPADVLTEATKIANSLSDVLRKQRLVSNIQGKEYPRCEAWTLLGTMLGVFPVLEWTREVKGGWEARVTAQTMSGAVVGAAEAMCLRSEKNWSGRDDYAIRSMAQTRATAKALRMPLGFVMTLGGFEATLAEEMTFHQAKPAPSSGDEKADKMSPGNHQTQEWAGKEAVTEAILEGWTVKNGTSQKSKKPYSLYTLSFNDEDLKFDVQTFDGKIEEWEVLKGQLCTVKHKPDWKGKGRELVSLAPYDELNM